MQESAPDKTNRLRQPCFYLQFPVQGTLTDNDCEQGDDHDSGHQARVLLAAPQLLVALQQGHPKHHGQEGH